MRKHPKTMRQQNTEMDDNQRATSVRKHFASQRAQTNASMTTEYQDRFKPPDCHRTIVSTSTQKNPYHPLKGTNMDISILKSYYVAHKWIKSPPKVPRPPTPPKSHQQCSSAPPDPVTSVENQVAPNVNEYTSVYQNDFRPWKANKRQPCKLQDNLKVKHGLIVPKNPSKGHSQVQDMANSNPDPQEQEVQPFESMTSYRADFVSHPVQPRPRLVKPVYQTNRVLPLGPAVSKGPNVTWDISKEHSDGEADFFNQFKNWTLETKFQGQCKAKDLSPSADQSFLSITHTDYTEHKCQHTKPILPCMQNIEKSDQPFQATTTMEEDFKAWNAPQRFPAIHKDLNLPKKSPVAGRTLNPSMHDIPTLFHGPHQKNLHLSESFHNFTTLPAEKTQLKNTSQEKTELSLLLKNETQEKTELSLLLSESLHNFSVLSAEKTQLSLLLKYAMQEKTKPSVLLKTTLQEKTQLQLEYKEALDTASSYAAAASSASYRALWY